MPPSRILSARWSYALVGGLALAARVSTALELTANDPVTWHPYLDPQWHDQWARAILAGQGWAGGDPGPFFRAPLYPTFLAAVYAVSDHPLAPRLTQSVLGAASAVLTCLLGRRLFTPATGLIAGLIIAGYGPMIAFDNSLLIPPLIVFLDVMLLVLALTWAPHTTPWAWSGVGAVAGMSAIARPSILITLPAFLWWAVKGAGWREKKRAAVAAGALAGGLCLTTLPVTLYNGLSGGEWVWIASQAGVNFFIGNNVHADGKTAQSPVAGGMNRGARVRYRDSIREAAHRYAEAQTGRALTASEVSAFWWDRSAEDIRRDVGGWLSLLGHKAYYLVNGYELPNNRDLYFVRGYSAVLSALIHPGPLLFPAGVLIPLALTGMILTARRWPDIGLLHAFVILYGAGIVAFFVTARYRMPLIPVAALFAAWTGLRMYHHIRTRAWRPFMTVAAPVLVFGGISHTAAFDIRDVKLRENYIGEGNALHFEGRPNDALVEFEKAIAADPGMSRLWAKKGMALLAMKQFDAAEAAYRRAHRLDPGDAEPLNGLGAAALEQNEPAQALAFFDHAIALNPENWIAWRNRAVALTALGRHAEAREAQRTARALHEKSGMRAGVE